jgi:hypothetical protein
MGDDPLNRVERVSRRHVHVRNEPANFSELAAAHVRTAFADMDEVGMRGDLGIDVRRIDPSHEQSAV